MLRLLYRFVGDAAHGIPNSRTKRVTYSVGLRRGGVLRTVRKALLRLLYCFLGRLCLPRTPSAKEVYTSLDSGVCGFAVSYFFLSEMPDIVRIFRNCTVSRENTCACNIIKRHLSPLHFVIIAESDEFLSISVAVEISKNHIRITVFE